MDSNTPSIPVAGSGFSAESLHATRPGVPGADPAHRFNNELRYRESDHPGQWHLTPAHVLAHVIQDLGGSIDLDPCTFPDNPTGAGIWYTAADQGEFAPWAWSDLPRPSVFCNPPYGKAREPWIKRCIEAGRNGQEVILLIPAATDTRIFQQAAVTSTALVFVCARLQFGTLRENRRQHAASHPSVLIGWNSELESCSSLGLRVHP